MANENVTTFCNFSFKALEEAFTRIQCVTKNNCIVFNGIRITFVEIKTIKGLLKLKSIKEIAGENNCTVTAERKRIDTIKRKLDCENQPLSKLFLKLKHSGITVFFLDIYF